MGTLQFQISLTQTHAIDMNYGNFLFLESRLKSMVWSSYVYALFNATFDKDMCDSLSSHWRDFPVFYEPSYLQFA